MPSKELNTRGLFIATIFLAVLAAVLIVLIFLIVYYSCNICTNIYPINKYANTPTDYVNPIANANSIPSNISTSITTYNTNALGLI